MTLGELIRKLEQLQYAPQGVPDDAPVRIAALGETLEVGEVSAHDGVVGLFASGPTREVSA